MDLFVTYCASPETPFDALTRCKYAMDLLTMFGLLGCEPAELPAPYVRKNKELTFLKFGKRKHDGLYLSQGTQLFAAEAS